MRLDADVTLCYGLKIVYDKCRENLDSTNEDKLVILLIKRVLFSSNSSSFLIMPPELFKLL